MSENFNNNHIDYGTRPCPPRPPRRNDEPLQFKRGRAAAFRRTDPILLEGEPAYEYDTKLLKVGDGVTRYNRLPYIGDFKGKDGDSAYEIWLKQGHTGTVDDFLNSLIGPAGKSAYELWLDDGHTGTVTDFLNSLVGDSAYEIWLKEGHTGTVSDFLKSLEGKSAYEIWLSLGHTGTEADFIQSLSVYGAWLEAGNTGTIEEFVTAMSTASWAPMESTYQQ
jgi:hypothetical protein